MVAVAHGLLALPMAETELLVKEITAQEMVVKQARRLLPVAVAVLAR